MKHIPILGSLIRGVSIKAVQRILEDVQLAVQKVCIPPPHDGSALQHCAAACCIFKLKAKTWSRAWLCHGVAWSSPSDTALMLLLLLLLLLPLLHHSPSQPARPPASCSLWMACRWRSC